MRELVLGLCLFSVSGALVITFSLMWFQDKVTVVEPWLWLRALEISVFTALAVFAGWCMIAKARETKGGK